LSTPRMPPEIYYRLRDHYLALLSNLYTQVATPVEAPSKASYGDIDILVSRPKDLSSPPSTESLAKVLQAARTFTVAKSATSSFAVPYPDRVGEYVQVDVHLCPEGSFDWQVFHQSHGDLWNLLGTTIRPFGLTANDAGLNIRIPEIEKLDRRKGLLLLTSEPDEVLDFLGMDVEEYQRPFGSVEAMYQYAVSCRFFRAETYVRGDLKANDRKRMAQRELYRQFVDEWVPANGHFINTRVGRDTTLTREVVQEAALARWAKRADFDKRVEAWRKERGDLKTKQEGRENRKEDAKILEKYADAWIGWLRKDEPVG
ncbi:hypothetical protein P7C71_g1746, partial [Lecanoromycetidae sp. Uapishka_2]